MRQVCVELPREDITPLDRQMDHVGHLQMSLYGTRDAAMNWQEEVAKEMQGWGFSRDRYNPCLYWNEKTRLRTMVHGDDFVSAGTREAVRAFRRQLEKRFEIKTQVIGSGRGVRTDVRRTDNAEPDEVQEGRVLNRIVRWTQDGWEVEPDQRHADIIVHELQLQESRAVSTPG